MKLQNNIIIMKTILLLLMFFIQLSQQILTLRAGALVCIFQEMKLLAT